jgi:predicted amidohydrolase
MAVTVKETTTWKATSGKPGRMARVALVQAQSAVGDEEFDPRDDNLARAIDSIGRAAADGADIVVFGELYLSGYRTDEWLHKWTTTVSPPDRHVEALIEEARNKKLVIVMGAATFGAAMPGDVYNSTLVIAPGGLAGVYRKCHVVAFPYSLGVANERSFYSPGKEIPVFETPVGKIGVHICYDVHFPEVARVQTLAGAELLINTSASMASFEDYWDRLAYTRAVENATWYIVCSVVGQQRDTVLFGGSQIVDPSGVVVAAAKRGEEDYIVADLDLDRPQVIRATTHALSTRQPALYAPIAEPIGQP